MASTEPAPLAAPIPTPAPPLGAAPATGLPPAVAAATPAQGQGQELPALPPLSLPLSSTASLPTQTQSQSRSPSPPKIGIAGSGPDAPLPSFGLARQEAAAAAGQPEAQRPEALSTARLNSPPDDRLGASALGFSLESSLSPLATAKVLSPEKDTRKVDDDALAELLGQKVARPPEKKAETSLETRKDDERLSQLMGKDVAPQQPQAAAAVATADRVAQVLKRIAEFKEDRAKREAEYVADAGKGAGGMEKTSDSVAAAAGAAATAKATTPAKAGALAGSDEHSAEGTRPKTGFPTMAWPPGLPLDAPSPSPAHSGGLSPSRSPFRSKAARGDSRAVSTYRHSCTSPHSSPGRSSPRRSSSPGRASPSMEQAAVLRPDSRLASLRIPDLDRRPRTSLPLKGSLCQLAASGDAEGVRALCGEARARHDHFLINQRDDSGSTALHHASFTGSAATVDELLQAGADVVLSDGAGRLPLHLAAYGGQVEMIRLLFGAALFRLRAKAATRCQLSSDPKTLAARGALSTYLRELLELRRGLLLCEDQEGWTPLHFATADFSNGTAPCLELMLRAFVECGDSTGSDASASAFMRNPRFQDQPGSSLLVDRLAADICDERLVQDLIQEHLAASRECLIDLVSRKDSRGQTLLHHAVRRGSFQAARVLLACGATPRVRADTVGGETPLDLAQSQVMDLLLRGGPNLPLQRLGYGEQWAHQEALQAALIARLHNDGKLGHPEVPDNEFVALLDKYPELDPFVLDRNGWTSLHVACAEGRAAELRLLIGRAKQLHRDISSWPGRRHSEGPSASKKAALSGRPIVETGRLTRLEATPVRSQARRAASMKRRAAGTGALLRPSSASVRAASTSGRTAKRGGGVSGVGGDSWSSGGDGGCVEQALRTLQGRSLTHIAAVAASSADSEAHAQYIRDGAVSCLSVLHAEGLLHVHAKDDDGVTPLLAACHADGVSAVRWLLQYAANLHESDNLGRNALHVAAGQGHRNLVRTLCHLDADRSKLQRGKDWKGRTPVDVLHAPLLRSDFYTVWEAARSGDVELFRRALAQSMGVDAVSVGGWSPLMCAAQEGSLAITKLLLHSRCSTAAPSTPPWDPEACPVRGRSALHLAAEAGHAEVCHLLCDFKARLEARCSLNRTPLATAALAGQTEAAAALVHAGAEVDTDVGGRGSLDSSSLLELLSKSGLEAHSACIRTICSVLAKKDPVALREALEGPERGLSRLPPTCTQRALQQAVRMSKRRGLYDF